MSKLKIHFVIDKTDRAKSAKKIILKKYKNSPPQKSNVIVVLGGDGFMLQTLKKFQKFNKPFYGMNRGTFGFLMNKFRSKNIIKAILRSKLVSISPLEAKITKRLMVHGIILQLPLIIQRFIITQLQKLKLKVRLMIFPLKYIYHFGVINKGE